MTPGWIELSGAHNARDLGGLPTADGTTAPGVLLRSDALDQLTDDDVAHLVDVVGLRHIIDLRSPTERAHQGRGPLGSQGLHHTELEVIGPADFERRRIERAEAYGSGLPPTEIMAAGYVELAVLGGGAFAEALRRLVEPDGTPALVHCAAGKDRTGVLVALLLDVAGVDRGSIVADYALSGSRMAAIVARMGAAANYEQVMGTAPAFVFEAVAETMEGFLAVLDERWDGAAGYFRAHGVDDATQAAWRRRLTA